MKKRIVSLLCVLALCLGLLPVTALAAGDAPNSLYVGDQQVISGNNITYWTTDSSTGTLTSCGEDKWNVKYDPSTATLTLSGATITGSGGITSSSKGAGIYAQCNRDQSVSLTIELIGNNTITGSYGIYVNAEMDTSIYGTDASLTITSEYNGSLEVSGSNHGIFVKSGTGKASLTINDASVVAKTTQTYSGYAGVYVQSSREANSPQLSLTVNGGSLTASGGGNNDGIQFYVGAPEATNATTSLTVTDNAIVDAKNGGISAKQISNPINTDISATGSNGGIVFDGKNGTVYGDVTLQEDLEIGKDETLTIGKDASLTVPEGTTLTNDGTITVESGGKLEGTPTGEGSVVYKVTGVTLDQTDLTLFTGQSEQLTATVTPDNATNKNVTWSSNDDTIATVDNNGNVTAVAAGTATITVTTEDGSHTATCKVTVKDPVYSMTTDTAVLGFDSKTEGYADAPAAKTVTITNTGNQPLTLAQPASTANFEVGTLSATELPVNGTATFTVQPKTGLAAGNYEETITVAATGGQYNVATNVTVKFAVAQKSVSVSDTSTPDDSVYYTCPACGYHNWTATDAGYRCDHCGYLESVKQLSGYANVKGTYTPGSSGTTTAVTVPQTGDQSSPALWVALLSVSGLALCGLVLCRRRQH